MTTHLTRNDATLRFTPPWDIMCTIAKISEMLWWAVAEKCMLGHLSEIASEYGISTGAVSSIVDDWRRSIGLELAIFIRNIGVTLHKLGMSQAQCATRFRISKFVERMGSWRKLNWIILVRSLPRLSRSRYKSKPHRKVHWWFSLFRKAEVARSKRQYHYRKSIESSEKKTQTKIELEEETKQLESMVEGLRAEMSAIWNLLYTKIAISSLFQLAQQSNIEVLNKW